MIAIDPFFYSFVEGSDFEQDGPMKPSQVWNDDWPKFGTKVGSHTYKYLEVLTLIYLLHSTVGSTVVLGVTIFVLHHC